MARCEYIGICDLIDGRPRPPGGGVGPCAWGAPSLSTAHARPPMGLKLRDEMGKQGLLQSAKRASGSGSMQGDQAGRGWPRWVREHRSWLVALEPVCQGFSRWVEDTRPA